MHLVLAVCLSGAAPITRLACRRPGRWRCAAGTIGGPARPPRVRPRRSAAARCATGLPARRSRLCRRRRQQQRRGWAPGGQRARPRRAWQRRARRGQRARVRMLAVTKRRSAVACWLLTASWVKVAVGCRGSPAHLRGVSAPAVTSTNAPEKSCSLLMSCIALRRASVAGEGCRRPAWAGAAGGPGEPVLAAAASCHTRARQHCAGHLCECRHH
jgi:hypothetical protein